MQKTIYFENAKKFGEEKSAQNVISQLHLEEYNLVFDWCTKNLKSDARILDWSALYGHVAHGLFLNGFRSVHATQYNPSPGSKYSLSSLEGVDVLFERHDPRRISYEDKFFKTVISCGVLEHVYETGGSFDSSLKEVNRLLEKQAFFVISHLPNARGLSEIKSDLLGKWSHPFTFTERGINCLAAQNGFEVVAFKRVGILPLKPRVFLKRLGLRFLANCIDYLAKFFPLNHFANDFFVVLKKHSDI